MPKPYRVHSRGAPCGTPPPFYIREKTQHSDVVPWEGRLLMTDDATKVTCLKCIRIAGGNLAVERFRRTKGDR